MPKFVWKLTLRKILKNKISIETNFELQKHNIEVLDIVTNKTSP